VRSLGASIMGGDWRVGRDLGVWKRSSGSEICWGLMCDDLLDFDNQPDF
jgi:hypothetical protein